MDAFEKWGEDYAREHPMYESTSYRERFYALEAYRAGMRAAAAMADQTWGSPWHRETAVKLRDAILAEADK